MAAYHNHKSPANFFMGSGSNGHSHDSLDEHTHHHSHSHSHEQYNGPGFFHERPKSIKRDFSERAFTVGICGPVGSGKTALMLQLCKKLREDISVVAVTVSDIFFSFYLTQLKTERQNLFPPLTERYFYKRRW